MEQRKLPVFRTVGRAYGFFLKKFFSIIHVSWFGIALLTLLMVGAYYFQVNPQLGKSTIWVAGYFVGQVAGMIIGVVVFIGLVKVYFDMPREKGLIYFMIDSAFWRFIIANILTYLLVLLWTALFIFAEIAGAAVLSGVDPSLLMQDTQKLLELLTPLSKVILSTGLIVYFIGFVLLAVRLQLFYPVIVVEQKIGLWRSWKITKNNFWRLIGASIVLGSSAALILFVLLGAAAFILGVSDFSIESGGTVDLKPQTLTTTIAWGSLALLTMLFFYSISVGFSSAAYEALKLGEEV